MEAKARVGPDLARLAAIGGALGIAAMLAAPPIHWLPPPAEAWPLVGLLLTAQAAITALTLAVTLFVLQGIGARRNVDDRVYREYVRRSWVRSIFWGSVGTLGATGLVLLADAFIGAGAPVIDATPGLPNLTLVAATAFVANLALAVALFERAIRLSGPAAWRRLQSDLNERDVHNAVHVFLSRYQRAIESLEVGEPNLADVFPDPGEGSADEAIRALLDEALRAMDERRQDDFTDSLDSIKRLVADAMDELGRHGYQWTRPGSQPEWPPLAELGANLFRFREEVVQRGNREHFRDLRSLDYWLMSRGVARRCGELFTVGVAGYRATYEIVSRLGTDHARETFDNVAWIEIRDALNGLRAEDTVPYVTQIVLHWERLLSSAMHRQRRDEFRALRAGFFDMFGGLRQSWEYGIRPGPRDGQSAALEQLSRIAVMGLGGRAMLLKESGELGDIEPYMDAARAEYAGLDDLASDIARAIDADMSDTFSWSSWEMEGATPYMVRAVYPARYALTFFSVRLLELVNTRMPPIDLGGSAQQVLDWFIENVERLEGHARVDPGTGVAECRELAVRALRDAVLRDDRNRERGIIDRSLDPGRVRDFVAEVYSSMFTSNTIERLFAFAGAFRYVVAEADGPPAMRHTAQLIEKAALTDMTSVMPYSGLPLGGRFEDEVFDRLCEAIANSPAMPAALDSATDLLAVIDDALDALAPEGAVLVLLTGDWTDILFDLEVHDRPAGYEPRWLVLDEGPEWDGVMGRYRGHPILADRGDGERSLGVVEPSMWGCFVRAQVDGQQDLMVEIETLSDERARAPGSEPGSVS